MNKLTDAEIVKSLESLLDIMRAYESQQASIGKGLVEDIISMYDRQKAEIERLDKRIAGQKHALFEQQSYTAELQNELKTAKSEAIKEFAKRLKDKADIVSSRSCWDLYEIEEYEIDDLVKEMVGDNDV